MKLTNEDRDIILERGNIEQFERMQESDRKDAALMRSAQRYYNARAIAMRGKPESEAIQVR